MEEVEKFTASESYSGCVCKLRIYRHMLRCSEFFANSRKFRTTSLVIGYFVVSTHYVVGTRKKASFVTCPDFSLSHIVGRKPQPFTLMRDIAK